MPFGEEIIGLGGRANTEKYVADDVRQGFTGYENDGETGLNYAKARMYSSSLGRFSSVDPIKMKRDRMVDPQRINLYGYVRNSPYSFVDKSGADLVLAKNVKAKDRDLVVKTLARLYMTKAGRAEIEKANNARFVAAVGPGKLENKSLNEAKPGETILGGKIYVVGGDTKVPYTGSILPGRRIIMAQETGQPESPKYPPIAIRMDKDNANEMGKDLASVGMHELRHFNNAVDEANKPLAGYPDVQGNDITGLDAKKDEQNARDAEKEVKDLPEEPSQEAIDAIENILKPRKEEKPEEKPEKKT